MEKRQVDCMCVKLVNAAMIQIAVRVLLPVCCVGPVKTLNTVCGLVCMQVAGTRAGRDAGLF